MDSGEADEILERADYLGRMLEAASRRCAHCQDGGLVKYW